MSSRSCVRALLNGGRLNRVRPWAATVLACGLLVSCQTTTEEEVVALPSPTAGAAMPNLELEQRYYTRGVLQRTVRRRTSIQELRQGNFRSLALPRSPADSANLYQMFGEVLEQGAPSATRTMSDGQPLTVALGHAPDPAALDTVVFWRGNNGVRAVATLNRQSTSNTYVKSMYLAESQSGTMVLETIATFDGIGYPLGVEGDVGLSAKAGPCLETLMHSILMLVGASFTIETPPVFIVAWLDAMVQFWEWLQCIDEWGNGGR